MKRLGLAATLIVGTIFVMIAYAIDQQTSAENNRDDLATRSQSPTVEESTPPTSETVLFMSSWAETYRDLGTLKQATDLAVLGTVQGVDGVDSDTRAAGAVTATLTFTDFNFRIEQTLHGEGREEMVIVHQTGGTSGGVTTEIKDDPLLQIGERYILFVTQAPSGKYFVAGGPTGRFVVRGDRVSSLSLIYPGRGINDMRVNNEPLADFIRRTQG